MQKPTINNTVTLETAKRLEDARIAAGVEWPIEFGKYYCGFEYKEDHVLPFLTPLHITQAQRNELDRLGYFYTEESRMKWIILGPAPNVAELLALLPYDTFKSGPEDIAEELVKCLEQRGRRILTAIDSYWAERFPIKENP